MTGVRGFLVPTDTPGFSAPEIKKKASLRASVTSELILDDVRVPDDFVLPGVASMRGPLSCLNEARFGIAFGAIGAGRACYESALDYSIERHQFEQPIASFQLTQKKLVEMMVAVQRGTLVALHLGRRKDDGNPHPRAGQLRQVRQRAQRPRGGPDGAVHPRRQRDHPRVPGHPAHGQPGDRLHLRGHQRDPHPRDGPGDHRSQRIHRAPRSRPRP